MLKTFILFIAILIHPLKNILTLPDTVYVSLLERNKSWLDHPFIIVIITAGATLLGVLIGQILQRRTMKKIYDLQGYLNRDKEFFVIRMEGCLRIAGAMSELYHVTAYKKDGNQSPIFPTAYISYQQLREWNNNTTKMVDRKLLLLNQNVYSKFTELNHLILRHLDEIEGSEQGEHKWNHICREIGRRDCITIQGMQADVVLAIKDFIKDKYNIEIEPVK